MVRKVLHYLDHATEGRSGRWNVTGECTTVDSMAATNNFLAPPMNTLSTTCDVMCKHHIGDSDTQNVIPQNQNTFFEIFEWKNGQGKITRWSLTSDIQFLWNPKKRFLMISFLTPNRPKVKKNTWIYHWKLLEDSFSSFVQVESNSRTLMSKFGCLKDRGFPKEPWIIP